MALATTPQQTVALTLNAASTTGTVTITSAPTGSVLLLKLTGGSPGSQAITYAPSSPNTTWSLLTTDPFQTVRCEVWMGVVAGGSSGTTVTVTANINFSTYPTFGQIVEWRGAYARAYHVSVNNATSGAMTTPTVTPLPGRVAVILAWGRNYSGGTFTASGSNPSNSFIDPAVSGSNNDRFAYRYQASTTGSYFTSWTWSSSGNTTRSIIVLYETAPPEIVLLQQPGAIASGATFSPDVSVNATTNGVTVDTSVGAGTSCTASIYSGSGTLLGTVTRTFLTGVCTFPGLGIATGAGNFKLAFTTSSYVTGVSNQFAVGTTISLQWSADPRSIQQGKVYSLSNGVPVPRVGYYVNGTLDTSATATLTWSKLSGPGSGGANLAGSTLAVAVGAGGNPGFADFTNIQVSTNGAYVFRVTAPTGETLDSLTVYVREAANTLSNAWSGLNDIIESNNGQRVASKLYVPSSSAGSVKRPLMLHASDSGNQGYDPDTLISKPGLAWVSTDQYFHLAIPISSSSNLAYSSWRRAAYELILRAIADGHPIDTDRIFIRGFSGAAQTMITMLYEYPTLFAGYIQIDGAWESNRMTAGGIGKPLAAMESIYYDATGADTACATRYAQIVKAGGTKLLLEHGNQSSIFLGRDINVMDILTNAFDAESGPAFEKPTDSSTLVNYSSVTAPYVLQRHIAINHASMEILVANSTNHPTVMAWCNAKSRGNGSIVPILRQRRLKKKAA